MENRRKGKGDKEQSHFFSVEISEIFFVPFFLLIQANETKNNKKKRVAGGKCKFFITTRKLEQKNLQ